MKKPDSVRAQIQEYLKGINPLTPISLEELYGLDGITHEQRHSVRAAIYGLCAGTPVSENNKPSKYYGIRLILNNPESANLHWAHFRWRDFGRFLLTLGPGGGFNEGDSPVLKNRRAIFPSAESFSPA